MTAQATYEDDQRRIGVNRLAREQAEQLDALFQQWDRADSPGVALGVIQEGELVYSRGYGMANLEEDIPITPETVFYLASVSKQFAAFAIALLVDDGVIGLDDPLRQWMPELPECCAPITIGHLVHHTSGLRDIWSLFHLADRRMDDAFTEADFLTAMGRQRGLNFAPGSDFSYTNSGYILLGLIVRQVTGKSLHEFTQERIFGPLGMSSTQFRDDRQRIVKRRAQAYAPADDGFRIDMPNFDLVADGGLYSSVADLVRWEQNFFSQEVGGAEIFKVITTPGPQVTGTPYGYMFGLMGHVERGLTVIEHGGAMAGYRTMTTRVPERRFSVICLANLGTINPGLLAQHVTNICLFGERVAPEDEASSPPVLVDLSGVYRNAETGGLLRLRVEDQALQFGFNEPRALRHLGELRFSIYPSGPVLRADPANLDRIDLEMAFWRRPPEVYERLPDITLSGAELEPFAGRWFSDELDAGCETLVVDGALTFRQTRHGDQRLTPVAPDNFANDELRLTFRRDAAGVPDGFELGTGRAWGIVFERRG